MPIRNVELTDHNDRFVEEQVIEGNYKNASEVLRAGLRLLEQHTQSEKHKLAMLRKLAAEGFRDLDQGQGLNLSGENELRKIVASIGRRAAKSAQKHRPE